MTRSRLAPSLALLLLAATLAAGCAPAAAPPAALAITAAPARPAALRLASGEWPPYTGENLPHYGCDAWVVTEAFALQGISVEYGFFPWARTYNLSAAGQWDGTLDWADTPEHRRQHYLSAEPLSLQEWVFYYRKDRPFTWNTLDDLAGKTIGLTEGYVYSDVFKDLQQAGTATFDKASSDEANFKMLLAGRIDVFPMERRVGDTLLTSSFSPDERAQLAASPKSLADFWPYLLLSRAVPQNDQRMRLFDEGFQRLQASGRYAQIMRSCAP